MSLSLQPCLHLTRGGKVTRSSDVLGVKQMQLLLQMQARSPRWHRVHIHTYLLCTMGSQVGLVRGAQGKEPEATRQARIGYLMLGNCCYLLNSAASHDQKKTSRQFTCPLSLSISRLSSTFSSLVCTHLTRTA